MEQRSLVQLRDLDCTATKTDVEEAMCREIGTDVGDIRVLGVMPTYGGEQSALVLIPRDAAVKLLDKGRIRVGLVYSRVREGRKITRCFKCLQEGHESRDCKGADRSRNCWRCGKPGHQQKDCSADANEAQVFREILKCAEGTEGVDKANP